MSCYVSSTFQRKDIVFYGVPGRWEIFFTQNVLQNPLIYGGSLGIIYVSIHNKDETYVYSVATSFYIIDDACLQLGKKQ